MLLNQACRVNKVRETYRFNETANSTETRRSPENDLPNEVKPARETNRVSKDDVARDVYGAREKRHSRDTTQVLQDTIDETRETNQDSRDIIGESRDTSRSHELWTGPRSKLVRHSLNIGSEPHEIG